MFFICTHIETLNLKKMLLNFNMFQDKVLIIFCIILIVIIIALSCSNKVCERFEVDDSDIKKIIQAMDDIIFCEITTNAATCLKNNKITDYVKFKKHFGNKFDLDTFLNLLNKRKNKSSSLTQQDIMQILHKTKTQIHLETFDSEAKNDCTQALKEYIASCNAKDEKYQQDYKTWQTVTLPAWQAGLTAEKQQLYNQWQEGLKLRANEIIWEGQFKACGGGYGGCCNEAPEWQKKCECAGISSGCNQCFGRIKYD